MSTTSYILERDYTALLEFIYQGKSWKQVQRSRLQPHTDFRHIIRTLIFEKRKPTLNQLADCEAHVIGKSQPDHSTILNSKAKFNADLKNKYSAFIDRLNTYYETLISTEIELKKLGSRPFRMDLIDGVTQVHLHFQNAPPSQEFLDGLKSLIETENKPLTNG